jgi:hypothetical protein
MRKATGNVTQDNRCSSRDWNWAPPDYVSTALPPDFPVWYTECRFVRWEVQPPPKRRQNPYHYTSMSKVITEVKIDNQPEMWQRVLYRKWTVIMCRADGQLQVKLRKKATITEGYDVSLTPMMMPISISRDRRAVTVTNSRSCRKWNSSLSCQQTPWWISYSNVVHSQCLNTVPAATRSIQAIRYSGFAV